MSFAKAKANTPLVVDSDAVLPLAVALQQFQSAFGKAALVAQIDCGIEDLEPSGSGILEGFESCRRVAGKQGFSVLASKRLDHIQQSITGYVNRNRNDQRAIIRRSALRIPKQSKE